MAQSTPRTFISIFTEDVDKIEIPIIQRDYAQGRTNDEATRVRTRFLNALHKALVNNETIALDFVYGDIDKDGKLIPLDGQQRLTTLYLLHWYISKHEDVSPDKCAFLNKFSYDTRYSAREFCKKLAEYAPNFGAEYLSADVRDQYWYPLDWDNDPTISAMLIMIDAIHHKFRDTTDIWEKLENGNIIFYFLSLKDMGLTDELYIKMNSRGKPLTQFEHFKAEFEGAMKAIAPSLANRISSKIDLEWTDMLWPYKGENDIIDDEFLRYFKYICDIICYKKDIPLISDPFDMITTLFGKDVENARENIEYVETLFDCWCFDDIKSFFEKYLTNGEHDTNKSYIKDQVNIFQDCCNVYGEMQSGHTRKFSIGRSILLYAFIQFILHKDEITEDQFIRRLRSVNNMVRTSEFELRDDRMQALLAQTEEIIITGVVNESDRSFKASQVKEEKQKQDWLVDNADKEALMREAEDHFLLTGAIRVLGLNNIDLFPRFEELFKCNWDLVNRALLAIGDYSRLVNWRFQIGSSKIWTVWRDMFNVSEEDMVRTKAVLHALLTGSEHMTVEYLQGVVDNYLMSVKEYDWRYYLVSYLSMRPERYGMYYWGDRDAEKKTRNIIAMTTEKSIGGWNYNIFLKAIYDILQSEGVSGLYLGHYAYQHDGDLLYFDNGQRTLASGETCFTLNRMQEDGTPIPERVIPIPQNENNCVDVGDRVQLGVKLIKDWETSTTAEA